MFQIEMRLVKTLLCSQRNINRKIIINTQLQKVNSFIAPLLCFANFVVYLPRHAELMDVLQSTGIRMVIKW